MVTSDILSSDAASVVICLVTSEKTVIEVVSLCLVSRQRISETLMDVNN